MFCQDAVSITYAEQAALADGGGVGRGQLDSGDLSQDIDSVMSRLLAFLPRVALSKNLLQSLCLGLVAPGKTSPDPHPHG